MSLSRRCSGFRLGTEDCFPAFTLRGNNPLRTAQLPCLVVEDPGDGALRPPDPPDPPDSRFPSPPLFAILVGRSSSDAAPFLARCSPPTRSPLAVNLSSTYTVGIVRSIPPPSQSPASNFAPGTAKISILPRIQSEIYRQSRRYASAAPVVRDCANSQPACSDGGLPRHESFTFATSEVGEHLTAAIPSFSPFMRRK
ncbi:unnamed protein product [Arabis nemorensis]|uniref:Uncharacterized protein n=1 Tax=Arabis nemorensis TaxID=586526 RepID=A0A565BE89_9BRAS|nr:unnamed protein product [Arabis nemorensis]